MLCLFYAEVFFFFRDWLNKFAPRGAILASMSLSGQLRYMTDHPLIIHPQYESAELRARVQEAYRPPISLQLRKCQIFKKEAELHDWVTNHCRTVATACLALRVAPSEFEATNLPSNCRTCSAFKWICKFDCAGMYHCESPQTFRDVMINFGAEYFIVEYPRCLFTYPGYFASVVK